MPESRHLSFKVVIPARYASTRLPGKPLLLIQGKPMIEHVYRQAELSGADEIVVATDDERIVEVIRQCGGEAMMTAADCHSGTDRIHEVATKKAWSDDEIVVNLQGDEPMMPPALLTHVAQDLSEHADASVSTLFSAVTERSVLFDPNVVKLVTDQSGYALYFSRAPIPWNRDEFLADNEMLPQGRPFYRHIGLYAYRVGLLHRFVNWPQGELEALESLEQLRILEHHERIHTLQASEEPGHGVDTADDLARVEKILNPEVLA
ncbi:MAG: 3-deoxy-manno-octulosonate cytidylyltransferase [gamma proteobacterium symbiont of Bathyaustriella thionipta]|nr:3-deoxy-manno-octulosonate cytidylyltransferase [gamma proteobacterium symbiont of Bathyaustriella thionipta]